MRESFGKNTRRIKSDKFVNSRGPSIPPSRDYTPVRKTDKPAGYAEIETVSQVPFDSAEWIAFVRDVVKMPETMVPAVQEAVSQQKWKISPNPLAAIRTAAYQEAKRMGLN